MSNTSPQLGDSFQGTWSSMAKRTAPFVSGLFESPKGRHILRMLELYINALQGKGAAGAWNFSSEVRCAASRVLSPDPVILDVGANVGSWSRQLSEHLSSKTCRFYLFEPLPGNLKQLEKNRSPNWKIFPVAVGDSDKEIVLYGPRDDTSTVATVYEVRSSFTEGYEFQEIKVPQITLDEVVRKEGLSKVDLLKMDIEGHELAALKGARASLEEGIIKNITFEFGATHIGPRTFLRDFWDLLTPLGFKFHRIWLNGRAFPLEGYYEDLEYFRGGSTFLATLD